MFIPKRRLFCFLMLIPLFFYTTGASAQETADHFVISQVYLDNNQPTNSWIEVYNATDKPLMLERLRISHIKTTNVLPKAIQDQGGLQVAAGEYLILCGNQSLFDSAYATSTKSTGVDALSQIATGGFIAVTTKGAGEAKGCVVRYGDPEKSTQISKLAGNQVVGFSKKGKSFTRKITRTPAGIDISNFVETLAAPGRPAD